MKLWVKYLIGIALGIICSLVFNFSEGTAGLDFLTEMFVRVGRYSVVPLVSATAAVSVFKLLKSKIALRTVVWTAAVCVGAAAVLTLTGLAAILIVKLPRIPITVSKTTEIVSIGIHDALRSLFPFSPMEALSNGTFLLAPFLFAACLGIVFSHDEKQFAPVISLCDSLSVLFYTITKVVVEVFSIGMIAVTCTWLVNVKNVFSSGIFTSLFVMLSVLLFVVALIIYPVATYLICGEKNPYRILYASLAPLFAALLSGDANLSLPVALCHTSESLGVRRRVNGFASPLLSVFARAGTGLVLALSFVVIRRSYTDLRISPSVIAWIFCVSFALSFTLGAIPSGGTFTALSVMCALYGQGFETGFLLLRPVAFVIGAFATALNVLTLMFGTYIVGVKTKETMRHSVANFL